MIERQNIKQILAKSIIELMNEKKLQKITVQMITDNCNLTRQTFYYHFQDKFDLVNWIFRTLIDDICTNSSPSLPWSRVLGDMLAGMKKHQKFYVNAMNCEGQNSFHQFITEYTRIAYAKELTKRLDSSDLSDEILFSIEFNSYGAAGMIYSWIKNNMTTDPYELAVRIADNMPKPMMEYFSM
ncbi:MAG: TetR/AcrR family transcriptional regulator C-terminal domain-containing protein [Clostridiaceae bacterium]